MSVAGITSIHSTQLTNVQRNLQKVQNEFKQLGQDLQSGNLTQAQADFVTLSQSLASPPNFVGPTAVHSALLGRTFLSHFTMTYEGRTGTVILSND